jgi:hypothetical protein
MKKEETEDTVEAMIISHTGVVSLVIGGNSHTVNPSHANYDAILEKIKTQNYVGLLKLMDLGETIKKASNGKVAVIDGSVFFDGREVINPMTDRILAFIKEGLPFDPMVKFLENLLGNPSRNAVQELYLFLEDNMLPITPDGHFLAYKKVREDYRDIHSGQFDNSVGQVCEMPRNEVCDIRDRTCSSGLHFCSKEYLPCFGSCRGNRVVIVKINPADVVSIPSDYNNAKGRTARYEVIGDCTDEFVSHYESRGDVETFDHLERTVLAGDEGYDYCGGCDDWAELDADGLCPHCDFVEEDPADEDVDPVAHVHDYVNPKVGHKPNGSAFHNERDNKGRFTKK